MNVVFKKIISRLAQIITSFFNDVRYFSLKLAVIRLFESFFSLLKINKLSKKLCNKKNKYIINYLTNKYGHIFINYNNKNTNPLEYEDVSKAPIWICWLDGIDNSPKLVQKCYKSILKCSGEHPVNLITWDNYSNYVSIPNCILDRINHHQMLPAHFSDVLRVCLLAKYGGLWLDLTIYCTKLIPIEYFKYDFFTCKSPPKDINCVSKMRWTTFCLGSKPNNLLFLALQEFFFEYWKNEPYAIDYLFFDDAIEMARCLMPKVFKMINEVPINNLKRDELISRFANIFEKNCCDDLFNNDTILFKLGYREKAYLKNYTHDGKPTVYNAFINNLL